MAKVQRAKNEIMRDRFCQYIQIEKQKSNTMFAFIKDAWRRLVAPINEWLFERYVRAEIRAGRIKEMIKREVGWRHVVRPSKGEVEMALVGKATELITASPNYSRKKNGKYPTILSEV